MRETFTKALASLTDIARCIHSFATDNHIVGVARTNLDISIEELFTNMVKYSKGEGRVVDIRVEYRGDRLIIEMREPDVDRFDPFTGRRDGGVSLESNRSTGGRGILMVKQIAKETSYQYFNRTGTTTIELETGDSNV